MPKMEATARQQGFSKAEEAFFQEGAPAPKRERRPAPPSEREEVAEQEWKPRARKEAESERKVIIKEDEKKLAETREALRAPSAEKFVQRSGIERDLATDLIHRMNVDLERGLATDEKMSEYRHQLSELRDRLEDLQDDARRISGTEKISDIVNQNYKALEKIGQGLQATALEEAEARHALKGITPEVEIRDEAKTSKQWEREIEEKYGEDPEVLRAGGGSFFKRNLFNFKHWLAQKTNQPSEYDLYRRAVDREHAKEGPALKVKEGEEDRVPPPPEKLRKELEKFEREEAPMTIERAYHLVPHAKELWDLSEKQMDRWGNPALLKMIDRAASKHGVAFDEKNPSTQMVLLVGKYLDMRDNVLNKEKADEIYQDVMSLAGAMKMKSNALLQQAVSESKPRVRDVLKGTKQRRAATARRSQRWKF